MQTGWGSKLISTLGNPSSKVPLAVKDLVNSAGFTYFSYDAGGKLEGKDRFIDEFGTQAIWLWGIPFFKKLIDKTAYKAAKLSPDVDVRVVNSPVKGYLELAKEHAPTKQIKENIIDAANNSKMFKKLFYGKFAASTALTLGAYFALTKIKQHVTKKAIEKEYMTNLAKSNDKFLSKSAKNPVFKAIQEPRSDKKSNNPAFGSMASALEGFMFNPVKNMFIVDAGITAERLKNSRTKGEFGEYAIKEGTLLFFMYYAGKHLQSGIEKLSERFLGKPIKLDAKFLSSDELKTALQNGDISEQIKHFSGNADDLSIYEFIFKNPKNLLVKAAQSSGIIETVKVAGEDVIDSGKYISVKKVKEVAKHLESISKSFAQSGEAVEKYLSKTKGLKILSTAANIGLCCLALGVLVPKFIYKQREKSQNGSKDFHVKEEYEKQLRAQLESGKAQK